MREKHSCFKFQTIVRLALFLSFAIVAVFYSVPSAYGQTCEDGQYSGMTQGSYNLDNDEWGLSADPGGWQEICTGSAGSNSWSSTWWWAKGTGTIKAYPSIYRGWQFGTWSPGSGFPVEISTNKPLPTSVVFSMTGNNQYDDAYECSSVPAPTPASHRLK